MAKERVGLGVDIGAGEYGVGITTKTTTQYSSSTGTGLDLGAGVEGAVDLGTIKLVTVGLGIITTSTYEAITTINESSAINIGKAY